MECNIILGMGRTGGIFMKSKESWKSGVRFWLTVDFYSGTE